MNLHQVEAKTSVFTLITGLFSAIIGWINVHTFIDTILIALISTFVGYFGTKVLKWIDIKIKRWIENRKNKPKA